jgi:hypothetical protein
MVNKLQLRPIGVYTVPICPQKLFIHVGIELCHLVQSSSIGSTLKLMMFVVLCSHLSTSMACAALAFAKAESFVFTFFFPTLN